MKDPTRNKTAPAASPARNPKQNDRRRFNAVRTGAYSHGLLPWESEDEYKKHCTEYMNLYEPKGKIEIRFVMDMAVNRWQRRRLGFMTSVATYRHGFGQAVEELARSWQEALSFVRELNIRHKENLDRIATWIVETGETTVKLHQTSEASKLMHEIGDRCTHACELLEDIAAKLDLEREFFEQYMPQKFEQRIRLENLLDAQFDKIHSHFLMLKEARLKREELLLSKHQAAAVNVLLGKPAIPEIAENDLPSNDGGMDLDAPDRDETDQPSADGGDRPWRHPSDQVNLDADDKDEDLDLDEDDPLMKFVNGK